MKRNTLMLICLACFTFVGAFFMALGSNMFFSDIGNIAAGESTLLVTVPAATVAMTFVVILLYLVRLTKHPDCVRRLSKLYSIVIIALNGVGAICNILGSLKVYGTLVALNPFPGYTIIFLVIEILFIALGVYGMIKLKDMKADENRIKISASYVFKTIGWVLFITLMLNRLGMFLGAPIYVYVRNLYKTFPFYLYLLLPLYLGVLEVLFIMKIPSKKTLYILTFVGIGLNVVLFAYNAIMGINDTGFISSLSEAMPLERLASKPLEILIHFLAYTGVSIALILQNKKAHE